MNAASTTPTRAVLRIADAVARLAGAGHPVITIRLRDPLDLGGEFVRWEIATATAGVLLGVNPFDEPDVAAAKQAAKVRLR